MEFKLVISKLANFYFFISNLSEWHFSCRKDYNKIWLNISGPLNNKEEEALLKFKKILNKYGFVFRNKRFQYLGQTFFLYPENQIWKRLINFVKKEEFLEIREIFNIFKPRFEKMWKLYAVKDKRVNILKKSLNQNNYQSIFKDSEKFFANKNKIKKIKIFIIFSPLNYEDTASGGANFGSNPIITLELPRLKHKTWQLDYSIGVLAHEVGHILYKSTGYRRVAEKLLEKTTLPKNLPKKFSPQRSTIEIIEELIINLLVPMGYLGQIYYKFKPTDIYFSKTNINKLGEIYKNIKKTKPVPTNRIIKYLTWQLYPLISCYIKSNKKIDKKFIELVIKSLNPVFK